jgi:hypothetical protein
VQGCQMVYFQTKNHNLGKNFEGFRMENVLYIFFVHLEYITAIWYSLRWLGSFVVIWYIFPRFGILRHEKSGNPSSVCPD